MSGLNSLITNFGASAADSAKLIITVVGGLAVLICVIMAIVFFISKKKRKQAVEMLLIALAIAVISVAGFAIASGIGSSVGKDLQQAIPAGTL